MARMRAARRWLLLVVLAGCDDAPPPPEALPYEWPPVVGNPYPDLTLVDADGRPVALSSFRGRVLLIEPVGMNCPACQAFAGGNTRGGFGGVTPQANLASIEEYLRGAGVDLGDERIVFVQLLLYGMDMNAPTAADAKAWRDHFGLKGAVVLVGTPEMLGPASYNLIPGFQLVGRDFVLRADSTGHAPRDNLYETLIPAMREMLD